MLVRIHLTNKTKSKFLFYHYLDSLHVFTLSVQKNGPLCFATMRTDPRN